ncbi:uncharacterized protein [Leptinotarsa decemlineata]|uniref:uncharacterized protein n=1 Tax=Leptinotarsa decemlineata TaxID=7539 RepID=UPI003D305533
MKIVPDEHLERQTCDVCHKFLTVAPVKIYRNKKTKCGRCSKADDDGNIIPPVTGAFKCVNRFDGCRKLLKIVDVVNHEKRCLSQAHLCPLCKSPKTIPTYMMIKHFQEHHESNLLKKSSIRVAMNQPDRRIFLHRVKDNLFFVEYNNMSAEILELDTIYLGRNAEKVTCRFTVYFGDDVCKMETIPMKCTDYGKPNATTCKFRAPLGSPQYAFVQIRIDLGVIETYFATQLLETPLTEVCLPRTLCLYDANSSRLSVGPDRTSLVMEDWRKPLNSPAKKIKLGSTEYIMFCFTCLTTVRVGSAYFIETDPLTFHIICDGCRVHFTHEAPDSDLASSAEVFPELKMANFAYSCVWKGRGCEAYIVEGVLEEHELVCPHQKPQRCPSMECYFVGSLIEVEKHFTQGHFDERLIIRRCSIGFDGEEDCGICHMWGYYGFISIKVAPYGEDFFVISIVRRRTLENFGQPNSELIVLELESCTVSMVTVSKPVMIKAGTSVQIWSFFSND